MTITLIQPQNKDGKATPMCAFDPKNGFYGHAFDNMIKNIPQFLQDGLVVQDPIILCTRCGVRWEVSHD